MNRITNRARFLNRIAVSIRAARYLEIGTNRGLTLEAVQVAEKHGVDPNPQAVYTHRMTSDAYFQAYSGPPYDLIFIDGLHLAEQVMRDIYHALSHLSPGGVAVCHDCLPRHKHNQFRRQTAGTWNGDTWKAFALFRADNPGVETYTVAVYNGMGVIHAPPRPLLMLPYVTKRRFTWKGYCLHRRIWLNTVSFKAFETRFPLTVGPPDLQESVGVPQHG